MSVLKHMQSQSITLDKIKLDRSDINQVGEGHYGVVYKAFIDKDVAVKVPKRNAGHSNEKLSQMFYKEIYISYKAWTSNCDTTEFMYYVPDKEYSIMVHLGCFQAFCISISLLFHYAILYLMLRIQNE